MLSIGGAVIIKIMSKQAIFDKKNILVVGGAGFVGSHLCDELIADNKVICLDNFSSGDDSNISQLLSQSDFKFIKHDIVEPLDLEQQPDLAAFRLPFQGLQEIYFLASPGSPRARQEQALPTMLSSSLGLKNVLDLAVKYKAKLLLAASPAVYGEIAKVKAVAEDYVGNLSYLSPEAAGAEADRFAEALAGVYRRQHNLDVKIVRIFNAYGPRLKLDDGRLISELIRQSLSGQEVTVAGDKKAVTSFFYIADLIKGLVKMMDSAEAGPINLGSEWPIKLSELAETVLKLTKSQATVKYQAGPAPAALPAIALAKEQLGWFPVTLLDAGLKETIDYLSAQQGILEPDA